MSSKTENRKLEIKAIKTILNGSSNMSAYLLGELKSTQPTTRFQKNIEGHFGTDEGNEIFIRMYTLLSNGKELPTLSMMKKDPALSKAAKTFLSNTKKIKVITKKRNAVKLIEILDKYRKVRVVRKGITAALHNLKEDTADIDDALIQLEDMVAEANSKRNMSILRFGKNSNSKKLLKRILSPHTDSIIKTYFRELDAVLGGFRRKQLVVISGPTGGGKSVLALNLGVNMYQQGKYNICYVSFEMDEEEMYMRILANIAYMDHAVLDKHKHTAQQRKKIRGADKEFNKIGKDSNCRLDIWCPEGEYTAGDIVQKLKPYNYDAIVIDYISLVSSGGGSSETEANSLSTIAKKFKLAASELNCAAIILAQWDEEHDRIRYARAIKEHANVLIKWKNPPNDTDQSEPVRMSLDKVRNAPVGGFLLRRNFKYMRWEDIEIVDVEYENEDNYNKKGFSDSINNKFIREEDAELL